MNQKQPNGHDLLAILVELLADQEQVEIKFDLEEMRESA